MNTFVSALEASLSSEMEHCDSKKAGVEANKKQEELEQIHSVWSMNKNL